MYGKVSVSPSGIVTFSTRTKLQLEIAEVKSARSVSLWSAESELIVIVSGRTLATLKQESRGQNAMYKFTIGRLRFISQ